MSLQSMTGFARIDGVTGAHRWAIEAKSVNAKGLDVRCRVPSFLDGLDIEIKKRTSALLKRGTVFINISIEREDSDSAVSVNREKLDALVALSAEYNAKDGVAPASFDGLLALRGVLETGSVDIDEKSLEAIKSNLLLGTEQAIMRLVVARAAEGARMDVALRAQIDAIEALTAEAKGLAAVRMDAIRDRFTANVNKLLEGESPLPDDRMAQEIAILAVKADVQEEIDRLNSHVADARELLASGEAVGRRLDFLSQEFNREANTLCSKSSDSDLTRVGLAMKAQIDQFREQIQNIE